MRRTQHLSLLSINYNNRLLATNRNELILEKSTQPRKKAAVWSILYCSPIWVLMNEESSLRLTFNTQSGSYPLVQIKDHQHDLLLRVSADVNHTNGNITLELLLENPIGNRKSPLFFVSERDNQIFRSIDYNFFKWIPNPINTLAILGDFYYDYVVIGSSFCALAFISRILEKNPETNILVLEKGFKYLSTHHQHGCSHASPGEVESSPWIISPETLEEACIENVHGQIPLLGGRSTYWSGWSPTPSTKEMVGWPEQLTLSLQTTYFALARKFLGVIGAKNINARHNNHLLYNTFQDCLKNCLNSAHSIESVEQVLHAPLAMGNDESIKFSTPEKLLAMKNVTVICDCTVEKIVHDGKQAISLETNRGSIFLPVGTKLILAMSTLPSTTLVLNSFQPNDFPQLSNVGKRFSTHFVSSVVTRVPRQNLLLPYNTADVELGALYINGRKNQAQYHLQLSGVSYTRCDNPSDIYSICKKYSANSIPWECIDVSQDFTIVSCSTLGELNYRNRNNQFRLIDNHSDLNTNGTLEIHLDDQDKELWKLMEEVTLKIMAKLSTAPNNTDLEYWYETEKKWSKDIPSTYMMRKKCLVHETSTMWMGDVADKEAPVSGDYRLKGIENVYITGGALWPTGGSWNPVVTIVAMAMHLADIIHQSTYRVTE